MGFNGFCQFQVIIQMAIVEDPTFFGIIKFLAGVLPNRLQAGGSGSLLAA